MQLSEFTLKLQSLASLSKTELIELATKKYPDIAKTRISRLPSNELRMLMLGIDYSIREAQTIANTNKRLNWDNNGLRQQLANKNTDLHKRIATLEKESAENKKLYLLAMESLAIKDVELKALQGQVNSLNKELKELDNN